MNETDLAVLRAGKYVRQPHGLRRPAEVVALLPERFDAMKLHPIHELSVSNRQPLGVLNSKGKAESEREAVKLCPLSFFFASAIGAATRLMAKHASLSATRCANGSFASSARPASESVSKFPCSSTRDLLMAKA